jgi:Amino acid permease
VSALAKHGGAGRERSSAEEITDVGPESTVAGLDEEELGVLRHVGEHWGRALTGRGFWLRGLPVDPALHRFPRSLEVGRRTRFAAVDFVETDDPAELVATPHASAGPWPSGRAASMWRRVVLGPPLLSSAVAHERMRKLVALAVLSSDALSSVAYGPEAMLAVLALAGSSALGLSLGISVAIVVLMLAVGLSYRQLIKAYPHGGGSYVVADRNLGELPALIAAAGLLIDYVLTVAVSISAGVAAITSAIPALSDASVALGLAAIAILLAGNLRGVRQAGALFSAPTYAFVLGIAVLITVGLVDASTRGFAPTRTSTVEPIEGLTVLLVLRAFLRRDGDDRHRGDLQRRARLPAAFGAQRADGPHRDGRSADRNVRRARGADARRWHRATLRPDRGLTAGSPQLRIRAALRLRAGHHGARAAARGTYGVQRVPAPTVVHGPKRARAPRLPAAWGPPGVQQRDARACARRGRAARSVRRPHQSADPSICRRSVRRLHASQAGMVVHWWLQREQHWRKSMLINAVGAALSAIVFVIAAVTKFSQGAWVAIALMVLLVLLCWRIRRH